LSFFIIYFPLFYHLFSIVLSFIFNFFNIYFSFFIISHHFLWLFHGFLMFCSIFDQKVRKMWRALGKIWWFSRNHRRMIKQMSKMIIKWKNSSFFCIFGISAHLAFLGPTFSYVFFIYYFSLFYDLFFIFYHLFFIFWSFLIIFFDFFMDFLCFAAFPSKKWGKCDEHLAKSDDFSRNHRKMIQKW